MPYLACQRPNDSALQLRPAGARGSTEQRPKRDVTNCNELTLLQSKGRCTKGGSASCKRLLGRFLTIVSCVLPETTGGSQPVPSRAHPDHAGSSDGLSAPGDRRRNRGTGRHC